MPDDISNRKFRDIDRMLIHSAMFQLGIIPMENPSLDMRRALEQLPASERRVLTRKFRKHWRKALKFQAAKSPKFAKFEKTAVGLGKQHPTRDERQARKRLVFNVVWRNAIKPMLAKIENPENFNDQKKEKSDV